MFSWITDAENLPINYFNYKESRKFRSRLPTTRPKTNDTHTAAAVTPAPKACELVAFAHATLFSPAISTLQLALDKGYLINFPGLTSSMLRCCPPTSAPMIKGHLDQSRKNQRSTAPTHIPPEAPPEVPPVDYDLCPPSSDTRTHMCFAATLAPTGQIYLDQTGRFVLPSSTGNNYIMIVYDYDSNFIFAQPFRNRTAKCILEAYKLLHARLCKAGLRPRLQRLDNECSQLLKGFMHNKNIDFQLVPPAVHRRNAAERAIRTFQNHFIAGLCSVDKDFPLHLWDQLLEQAELSLNLLRGSRLHPKLSAWAHVNGLFDFNRRPLAPPGCRVLVHNKPQNRTTWSPHALDGWYVGPALDSYRCYRVWIWDTRMIRICDTVAWFPTKVHMPKTSSTDIIHTSLQDIAHALQHPVPRSPVSPIMPSHKVAIRQLLDTLTTILPSPDTLPVIPPPLRVETPGHDTLAAPTIIPNDDLPRQNNDLPHPLEPCEDPPLTDNHTPSLPRDDPLPAPSTYDNVTGPRGQQQRKRQRANQSSAKTDRRIARSRSKRHALTALTMCASPDLQSHYCLHGSAINPDTGQAAEYRELLRSSTAHLWSDANSNEIGRLFQGLGSLSTMPTGTNCCFFIPKHKIPRNKKPTYIRIVCADRPKKSNPQRVRWTAGGDKIFYVGNVTTKTADITTAKCLFNSVLSTPSAQFMTMDLADFYLESHMPANEYEYVRIPIWMIPANIQTLYNLQPQIIDGHVFAEIRRGMYGLPQAGKLANEQLQAFLAPHGYIPCLITPGLWKDTHSNLMFALVVDDFDIRYSTRQDADHTPSLPCDDPLPAPSTYDNVTGPRGQQQRKRQRANQSSAKTDRRIARSRSKRHALTALTMCASPDLQSHYCLHGSAINPDTGQAAEYCELLRSSTAHLWSDAYRNEIGRLFQGRGSLYHANRHQLLLLYTKT